jgi:DNA-binding IclR family transcriptional regulator
MRHMPRRPNTPQSVVGRVLAIFECFAEDSKPLSLNEISRHSGLPLSTTHRLVSELHSGGALVRDDQRRYGIGPRLQILAAQHHP